MRKGRNVPVPFFPVAEDVDGAAPENLLMQAGKELAAGGTVFAQAQGRGGFRLGRAQKGSNLDQFKAEFTVVVVVVAGGPADTT